MSDEIFSDGKQLVSAKKAATESGYARDYIGQLARKGLIQAQRVGGLWYVSMESLKDYQANAEAYVPPPLPPQQSQGLDSVVNFDGKDYISASKAAKLSGYHQDYIGQLARAGKILSRQIGNRWYVERTGLLAHKSEKDAMLGAVQAEAAGLYRPSAPLQTETASETRYTAHQPLMQYINEDNELMPTLLPVQRSEARMINERVTDNNVERGDVERQIPIRISRVQTPTIASYSARKFAAKRPIRRPRNTMIGAAKAGIALTFVIVLSYGIVTLKKDSVYTYNSNGVSSAILQKAAAVGAYTPIAWIAERIEKLIAPEIIYRRAN